MSILTAQAEFTLWSDRVAALAEAERIYYAMVEIYLDETLPLSVRINAGLLAARIYADVDAYIAMRLARSIKAGGDK